MDTFTVNGSMSVWGCIHLFTKKGFDVNSWKNKDGFSPLHAAAEAGERKVVEALVEIAAADVNAECKLAKTPLFYASRNGHTKIASYLIQHGATLHDGLLALHEAALYGRAGVVKVLLAAGANSNEVNMQGRTAARVCCLHRLGSTSEQMQQRGKGKAEALKAIIDSGGDINKLCDRIPHLHVAAINNLSECVELLVNRGLDVNMAANQQAKQTALHYACYNGCIDTIKQLSVLGANLEAADADGRSPLFHAASQAQHEAISVMIELGASVMAKDNAGFTPLHVASACGRLKCAYLLVEHGADINTLSDDNIIPLVACQKPDLLFKNATFHGPKEDRVKVAKFLLEVGAKVDEKVGLAAIEGDMFGIIMERIDKLTKISTMILPDLVVMAVKHAEEVVNVRLVDMQSGKEDEEVIKLNMQLVHHLVKRQGEDKGGDELASPCTVNGSSVVSKLLHPAKFGYRDSVASSNGQEVKLEFDGTDFTKDGFVAAVEYLTTGSVERVLVRKKRMCNVEANSCLGCSNEGKCLFDAEAASKTLQAARYFCLDGMADEVKRLMDIYGFEYEGDPKDAVPT